MIALTIILLMLAMVCLTIVGIFILTERKSIVYRKEFYYFLAGTIVFFIAFFFVSTLTKHKIEDNAIKGFLNGEYEVYEESVNGQVISTTYKLIEVEYD